MQDPMIDRLDSRLLHALQIEPRASWSELAPVVGADAATLSRRWQRMRDEGIAWVTCSAVGGYGALLEIDCSPRDMSAVAEALAEEPQVVALDYTSGGRDLFATIYAEDQSALADYVTGRLSSLRGIRAARTNLVTERLVAGDNWRLRELSADEIARVPKARPPRPRAARRVSSELRGMLARELARDGRATVTAISQAHGISVQRVADAIALLRNDGTLEFRTDIARAATGWPIFTWYFLEVPASTIEKARSAIIKVPEVRAAVTCSSRYNLILAVWLRTLADVNKFEVALENALPGARIADRSVVLRIRKRLGMIVDNDSRATGRYIGP